MNCIYCNKPVEHSDDGRPILKHVGTESEICNPKDLEANGLAPYFPYRAEIDESKRM